MEYHNTVFIPVKVNEKKNITILQNQIISRKNKLLCVHYTGGYKKKVYKKMGYYKRGKISYDFKLSNKVD